MSFAPSSTSPFHDIFAADDRQPPPVTAMCPTVTHHHCFDLDENQTCIVAAYNVVISELEREFHVIRQRGFTKNDEDRLNVARYHSFAMSSIDNLCNFHMAMSSSGEIGRPSRAAAVTLHGIHTQFPVDAYREAVLRNRTPMQVVDVLGRKSAGWHEGIIEWAQAHVTMLLSTVKSPGVGECCYAQDDFVVEWNSAVLQTIWHEFNGIILRPFTDTIRGGNSDAGDERRDGLEIYQEPLTVLQKRILKELWNHSHPVRFRTLQQTAWKDKELSDTSIKRRLTTIEKRWIEAGLEDIDLEISVANATVKLVKPRRWAGDKKGDN